MFHHDLSFLLIATLNILSLRLFSSQYLSTSQACWFKPLFSQLSSSQPAITETSIFDPQLDPSSYSSKLLVQLGISIYPKLHDNKRRTFTPSLMRPLHIQYLMSRLQKRFVVRLTWLYQSIVVALKHPTQNIAYCLNLITRFLIS